ncbi:hypothetical protein [Streptomyces genisteinicus]|uniref:Uncharacterized protein n=1 Tax=Streptomyces genisteinicus TaxID=2768068 RepID=A0A7H0HQY3_9ACTN|nr:hypothetical protein [Streptomyces genisteinicus]QNP62949.1 hypothetical protein IAG43_08340 [Streptomyces genisteinicus]
MSGPLWQEPGDLLDALPVLPRQPGAASRGARAADPLDALALRLHDVIAAAVHPDEVAAILESDGMTDDHIRLAYGRSDSFALAAELYAKVPRSHPEPPVPAAAPWHTGLLGSLLRGLLFALPGLGWLLAAPLLGEPVLPPLLAGALTGWMWNQAMAHRAYCRLGLGDRPAAARCLAAGAPAGVLLATAATVVCTGPGQWPSAVFSTAQAVYLAAATALLVLGRERALLHCLLPLPAGAAALLVTGLPVWARALLLSASLTATVLSAATLLRRTALAGAPRPRARTAATGPGQAARTRVPAPSRTAPAGGRLPSARSAVRAVAARFPAAASAPARPRGAGHRGRPVRGVRPGGEAAGGGGAARPPERSRPPRDSGPRPAASLPHGLFGLGAGVLVLHTALGDVFHGEPGALVAGPSAVALTLGNGPAEWLLHRFRGGALAGLRSTVSTTAFRRAAVLVLARCLTAHLLVLWALAAAGTLLWPGAPGLGGVRLATLLLVGSVLWTGLLLQAFGKVTAAAAVVSAAALVQTALTASGAAPPGTAGLAVAAVSAAALLALACALLGRATAHRP